MPDVYTICAVVGGTLFVLQFALSLFGIGDHHGLDGGAADHAGDFHGHHPVGETSWFLGLITLRGVIAAVAFFGLTGLAARSAGFSSGGALAAAVAAGAAALVLVAFFLRSMRRLGDEGTVRLEGAVGARGVVYLNIPAANQGLGKVTLEIQNRTIECEAVTLGPALASGTPVVVAAVVSPDRVEVVIADDAPRPIPLETARGPGETNHAADDFHARA